MQKLDVLGTVSCEPRLCGGKLGGPPIVCEIAAQGSSARCYSMESMRNRGRIAQLYDVISPASIVQMILYSFLSIQVDRAEQQIDDSTSGNTRTIETLLFASRTLERPIIRTWRIRRLYTIRRSASQSGLCYWIHAGEPLHSIVWQGVNKWTLLYNIHIFCRMLSRGIPKATSAQVSANRKRF